MGMTCERGAKAGAGAGERGKEHEEQEEQEEHAVPTSAGCIWARGRASALSAAHGGSRGCPPQGGSAPNPAWHFPAGASWLSY